MRAEGARTIDGALIADSAAIDALRNHALVEFPKECIGIINRAGAYVPMVNVAPNPVAHALIDKRLIADALMRGDLTALCHSHPGGPDCPSESDMLAQIEMEVPFVIVSTNGEACATPFVWGDQVANPSPIVGRPFRHGVTDCYALIRAWWLAERGVMLPDYPRNWNWWLDPTPGDKDLYRRYFADAGFHAVDRRTPREGDVWLAAIRSDVPNHAGLYLDGGLALHHPSSGLECDPGRLSKRESIARWSPWITHWLRRE